MSFRQRNSFINTEYVYSDFGQIVRKTVNLSGTFTGSLFPSGSGGGSSITNTGSFLGNFTGSFTGSYLGNFSGTFSGSFSGSQYLGNVVNSVNNFTGSITLVAGPGIVINNGSPGNIAITASSVVITGSDSFFVTNGLDIRGFLSSSTNNHSIAFSAAIDINDNTRNFHVNSRSSPLILSSSVGSIIALSSSLDFPNIDKNYHLRAINSHLILSSSNGSIVSVSSSLDLNQVNKSYHIRSVNNRLVLSSSVNSSIVAISGNLWILNPDNTSAGSVETKLEADVLGTDFSTTVYSSTNSGGTIAGVSRAKAVIMRTTGVGGRQASSILIDTGNADNTPAPIYLASSDVVRASFTHRGSAPSDTVVGIGILSPLEKFHVDGAIALTGSLYNRSQHLILSSSAGSIASFSCSVDLNQSNKNYHIRATTSDLILSSSSTSVVVISGSLQFQNTSLPYHIRAVNQNLVLTSSGGSIVSFSASSDFPNTDKNYHIRSVNSDLILSSSSTSKIFISGTLIANQNISGTFLGNGSSLGGVVYKINNISGTLTVTAGPNIFVNSSGQDISISSSQDITGSNAFFVQNGLDVRGFISSSVGDLIFSGSIVSLSASQKNPFIIVSSQYTISNGDNFIVANTTGSSVGIVLPTAIGNAGLEFTIKRSGSYDATISSSLNQFIDDSTTQTLITNFGSVTVVSDGANWLIK